MHRRTRTHLCDRTLAEWQRCFAEFTGVWSASRDFRGVHQSAQVHANGYLPEVDGNDGAAFRLVALPYQFDGQPAAPRGPAPELGQHTEEVLLDSGFTWDEIADYRDGGALG